MNIKKVKKILADAKNASKRGMHKESAVLALHVQRCAELCKSEKRYSVALSAHEVMCDYVAEMRKELDLSEKFLSNSFTNIYKVKKSYN